MNNAGLGAVIIDVIRERVRQVEDEGFDAAHDDEEVLGQLARAGASYALSVEGGVPAGPPVIWPWARAWWKPKNRRRDLVRAAALIIAEIERIDRLDTRASR